MNLLARRGARFSAFTAGAALGLAIALIAPAVAASATAPALRAAAADTAPLTNLAHLDFLLDEATPPQDVAAHTTYRLAEEPTLIAPWTYADARPAVRVRWRMPRPRGRSERWQVRAQRRP